MVTLINRVFDGWSWRNLSPEDPFDVPDPDEVEVKRVGNVRVLISKHYTDEFVKDVTRFALEPRTSVVDPIEELLWRWNFDKEEALEDEDHSYWDRKSMRMSLVEAVETLKDRHFDPITIARAVRRYTELLKEPEEFLIEMANQDFFECDHPDYLHLKLLTHVPAMMEREYDDIIADFPEPLEMVEDLSRQPTDYQVFDGNATYALDPVSTGPANMYLGLMKALVRHPGHFGQFVFHHQDMSDNTVWTSMTIRELLRIQRTFIKALDESKASGVRLDVDALRKLMTWLYLDWLARRILPYLLEPEPPVKIEGYAMNLVESCRTYGSTCEFCVPINVMLQSPTETEAVLLLGHKDCYYTHIKPQLRILSKLATKGVKVDSLWTPPSKCARADNSKFRFIGVPEGKELIRWVFDKPTLTLRVFKDIKNWQSFQRLVAEARKSAWVTHLKEFGDIHALDDTLYGRFAEEIKEATGMDRDWGCDLNAPIILDDSDDDVEEHAESEDELARAAKPPQEARTEKLAFRSGCGQMSYEHSGTRSWISNRHAEGESNYWHSIYDSGSQSDSDDEEGEEEYRKSKQFGRWNHIAEWVKDDSKLCERWKIPVTNPFGSFKPTSYLSKDHNDEITVEAAMLGRNTAIRPVRSVSTFSSSERIAGEERRIAPTQILPKVRVKKQTARKNIAVERPVPGLGYTIPGEMNRQFGRKSAAAAAGIKRKVPEIFGMAGTKRR